MIYLYESPTGEVVEVSQSMTEPHVYEENGVKYERVWTVPQATIDARKTDPYSKKQFLDRTDGKKQTLGDLMDRSNEMSEKRAEKEGEDPIRKREDKNWSESRGGRQLPKKLDDVVVDFKVPK